MTQPNDLLIQFISDASDLIDSADEALINLELQENDPADPLAS